MSEVEIHYSFHSSGLALTLIQMNNASANNEASREKTERGTDDRGMIVADPLQERDGYLIFLNYQITNRQTHSGLWRRSQFPIHPH